MNRTSRVFLMASGFVLAAGLGTGLVAYFGGGLHTFASARSTGPDELKFVPESAAVVAYATVRDVMTSEFRQKLRQVLPDGDKNGQEEFQRETGIHILRPDPTRHNDGRETVEATPAPDGAVTRERHLHDGPRPMVAFLEPGLVALGEEGTIRAAIANQKSGGRSILDNQSMTELMGDLEGSSNIWAVGRMDALTANAQLPEPLAQHLPAVKWFSASSHIGAGLSGLLRAEARDEESAKNLRDVLQGFMALAKLHAGQKPEFAPVMQSLTVSGTGTTVALSFEVPPALVDTLIELKHAN